MTNHPIEPHPVLVRMAKALAARNVPGATKHREAYIAMQWRYYLPDARAALLSLRELTPDVVEAGCNAIESAFLHVPEEDLPFPNAQWEGEARECLTAMINTIIGESA